MIDQGAAVVKTSGQKRSSGYLKEVPSFSLSYREVEQTSLSTTKRHRVFFADESKVASEYSTFISTINLVMGSFSTAVERSNRWC